MKKVKKEKATETKVDTKTITYNLYIQTKTIDEIAKERNLTKTTIETHLAHYVGLGELNINDFVTKEKQQKIKDAVAIHGPLSHKTLLENLPAGFSYGELKMVLAKENV